jgi:hypothetical protein
MAADNINRLLTRFYLWLQLPNILYATENPLIFLIEGE